MGLPVSSIYWQHVSRYSSFSHQVGTCQWQRSDAVMQYLNFTNATLCYMHNNGHDDNLSVQYSTVPPKCGSTFWGTGGHRKWGMKANRRIQS